MREAFDRPKLKSIKVNKTPIELQITTYYKTIVNFLTLSVLAPMEVTALS
jgi:hypothetical protein